MARKRIKRTMRTRARKQIDGSKLWNMNAQPRPLGTATNVLDNRVFDFIQTTNSGIQLTGSSSAFTSAGIYFTMTSHVEAYTRFANLFGQYRFKRIEAWLEPQFTTGSVITDPIQSNAGTSFYSVIDFANANSPPSSAAMMSYSNCLMSNYNTGHYHSWVPHVAQLTAAGTGTAYTNTTAPWLDFSDVTAEHLGIKVAFDTVTIGTVVAVGLVVRIHFSCRNPLGLS
jgi:hypothetical protein